jgi:bla regulator protein BlaR1
MADETRVSHTPRRDNLIAALHMGVQGLFWFHPLVWWVGARLVAERERACDDEVVQWGSAPHVYAESILRTSRFCVESPAACVSGVTGSDLRKRIEAIMRGNARTPLNVWKWAMLAAGGAVAIGGPLMVGLLDAPRLDAQTPAAVVDSASFEVASIKRNMSGDGRASVRGMSGGRVTVTNDTLRNLIRNAYRLQDVEIVGGPDWQADGRFDIVAKANGNPTLEQMLVTRA